MAGGQARTAHLQFEVGNDRTEVGVAAALAVAVHGALDLHRALAHGLQGVGHGQFAVVVGVDAEAGLGQLFTDGFHDGGDLSGQAATVGVAEHQEFGAGFPGRAQGGDGVFRVGLVAVEEVFRIIEQFLGVGAQERQGIADELQVAFQGDLQGVGDVDIPAFTEDGQHRCPGFHQSQEIGIILGGDLGGVRGAECGEFGGAQLILSHLREEAFILGIGARPATFDVGDAELVEPGGNAQLVFSGKIQFLGLRAVPQRGVIDLDGVHGAPGMCSRVSCATGGCARDSLKYCK